jgi:hypothetical protein
MKLIKTFKNLIIKLSGKTYTVPKDAVNADEVESLIKAGKPDEEILPLVDYRERIRRDYGDLSFEVDGDNNVFIDGEQLPKTIADRLFGYSESKIDERVKAIILFWRNCLANPDPVARTDLFDFLAHNNMPITDDGHFLAYRYVTRNENGDLVDCKTGKMINNVGVTVQMNRSDCDPDRNSTCSTGLHCCSHSYVIEHGSSGVITSVKVNPANVVAIPVDYQQRKLRACEFTVMEIIKDNLTLPEVKEVPKFEQTIVNDYTQFVFRIDTKFVDVL